MFFLLLIMVLKRTPKPQNLGTTYLCSALDGMCYAGEEVWGLFGMQLPIAGILLAWAHRLGMLVLLLCTPISSTLVLKCK